MNVIISADFVYFLAVVQKKKRTKNQKLHRYLLLINPEVLTVKPNDVVKAIRSGLLICTIDDLILDDHDVLSGIVESDALLNLTSFVVAESNCIK